MDSIGFEKLSEDERKLYLAGYNASEDKHDRARESRKLYELRERVDKLINWGVIIGVFVLYLFILKG